MANRAQEVDNSEEFLGKTISDSPMLRLHIPSMNHLNLDRAAKRRGFSIM